MLLSKAFSSLKKKAKFVSLIKKFKKMQIQKHAPVFFELLQTQTIKNQIQYSKYEKAEEFRVYQLKLKVLILLRNNLEDSYKEKLNEVKSERFQKLKRKKKVFKSLKFASQKRKYKQNMEN